MLDKGRYLEKLPAIYWSLLAARDKNMNIKIFVFRLNIF